MARANLYGGRTAYVRLFTWLLSGVILLGGCGGGTTTTDGGQASSAQITSAHIVDTSTVKIASFGDLWLSTWDADGNVYMAWGDGTGPGTCYPVVANAPADQTMPRTISAAQQNEIVFGDDFCKVFPCDGTTVYSSCELTQAGLYRLAGPIADFAGCQQDACIQSRRIPSGQPQFAYGQDATMNRGDKPSSLLAIDGMLYWAGHQLMIDPKIGYIAWSSDRGKTWNEVPNSPWVAGSGFRVVMFFNMGRNFELNSDGWVYGLAIESEITDASTPQPVHLLRVPRDSIANYAAYRYFSGMQNGVAQWSTSIADKAPLDNLNTVALGAAMYHPGVKKYLFLAVSVQGGGPALTLFYADQPWGPWKVGQVFDGEFYIPGIISKDTGPTSFWFTGAGGAGMGSTYQLTIGKIEMALGK